MDDESEIDVVRGLIEAAATERGLHDPQDAWKFTDISKVAGKASAVMAVNGIIQEHPCLVPIEEPDPGPPPPKPGTPGTHPRWPRRKKTSNEMWLDMIQADTGHRGYRGRR